MAKASTKSSTHIVAFTGGDYKPKRLASGLIGLRAPFPFSLKPLSGQTIDLGSKCQVGLLLDTGKIISPGQNIMIDVYNSAGAPVAYEAGEVIARAYPLLVPDYEIK